MRTIWLMLALAQGAGVSAAEPATLPAAGVIAPRSEVDPNHLWKKPAAQVAAGSLGELCFALQRVGISARADDTLADRTTGVVYFFNEYEPTWAEWFHQQAGLVGAEVVWDPEVKQWWFREPEHGVQPMFSLTLAEGWRSQNRPGYVWYAPPGAPCGMDVYTFGPYVRLNPASPQGKAIIEGHAQIFVSQFPNPKKVSDMEKRRIDGHDALFIETESPREGWRWRQWTYFSGGYVYLIVSMIPVEKEETLLPQLMATVESFHATPVPVPETPRVAGRSKQPSPATRPAP